MSGDEELFTKIGAYVDGELPATERDDVESLIAGSPLYQRAAEDFQWLDQLAGSGSVPAVSGDDWVRVKEGVLQRRTGTQTPELSTGRAMRDSVAQAPRSSRPSPVVERWRGVLPLAALALFAASLGIVIYSFGPGSPPMTSGGAEIGPGQASSDAIEHLDGPRPTTIEVDDEGGASTVFYEDF